MFCEKMYVRIRVYERALMTYLLLVVLVVVLWVEVFVVDHHQGVHP